MSFSEAEPLTVTDVTVSIKKMLATSPVLSGLLVCGELASFTRHGPSGHLYFDIRDDNSRVSCVMFRSDAARLTFEPETGMEILLSGRVSFYEKRGTVQIYAGSIEPYGAGAAALALKQLKSRLTAEGLFDISHKRNLPLLPDAVGIVTSASGAALADVLDVMGRRFPGFKAMICHASVQGNDAPDEIVRALRTIAGYPDVEVVILARGGGSTADLEAFNDELVVRAVAAMPVPVVTGIGHETDYSLADLAADCRAPTPSAAAELVMPDRSDLLQRLNAASQRLAFASRARVRMARNSLQMSGFADASRIMREKSAARRLGCNEYMRTISESTIKCLERQKNKLGRLAAALSAMDPGSILSRGYAVAYSDDGKQLLSAPEQGSRIILCFDDHAVQCDVTERIGDDADTRIPDILRRRYERAGKNRR